MGNCIARVSAAAAVSAAIAALGATGVSAAGAATRSALPVRAASRMVLHVPSTRGMQRWVQRYNGSGKGSDAGRAVAVSPGGRRVFVMGESTGASSGLDYATIAYSAATGARLWVSRYNGPANGKDVARAVAASPGGGTVYVTGDSPGSQSSYDYATVAYNAATGARLWVSRYNGPANGDDIARTVAVSPGGGTVYVTGYGTGTASGGDYATVAYNAATGAQRWVSRYNGPGNAFDIAYSVAVSPDGARCMSPEPAPEQWLPMNRLTTRRWPTTPPLAPSGGSAAITAPAGTTKPGWWRSVRTGGPCTSLG